LGVADAAVATCGAVGLAAVSVRTAEARRAAALCGAAAAVVAACVRDFRGTPA